MKLLTQEIKKNLLSLEEVCQKNLKDLREAVCHVKFFTPWSNWSWFPIAYCPEREEFFGFVVGHYSEWGYFSLRELENIEGPYGLSIERDKYFRENKMSEIPELKGILR
jgi:hypothetical protein